MELKLRAELLGFKSSGPLSLPRSSLSRKPSCSFVAMRLRETCGCGERLVSQTPEAQKSVRENTSFTMSSVEAESLYVEEGYFSVVGILRCDDVCECQDHRGWEQGVARLE